MAYISQIGAPGADDGIIRPLQHGGLRLINLPNAAAGGSSALYPLPNGILDHFIKKEVHMGGKNIALFFFSGLLQTGNQSFQCAPGRMAGLLIACQLPFGGLGRLKIRLGLCPVVAIDFSDSDARRGGDAWVTHSKNLLRRL